MIKSKTLHSHKTSPHPQRSFADDDYSDFEDLNIWSDAAINTVIFSSIMVPRPFPLLPLHWIHAQFALPPKAEKYRFKNVVIGYIENNQKLEKEFPINSFTGPNLGRNTSMNKSEWDGFVKKYLSEEGKVKYGTNAWVVDAFGNSNVFSQIIVP